MSKNNAMDLSYFMTEFKPENVEYPAPERFVDADGNRLNLVFRVLSEEEQQNIRNHYRKRKMLTDPKTKKPIIVNGAVAMDETYDSSEALQEMLVESLVYPNLKDKDLMAFYHCDEAIKMPLKVFPTLEEQIYVFKAFNEINGYNGADEDDIGEAKN